MTNFAYDAAVRSEGYTRLCGVDEAGRGPLAGPVYAAAVIFAPDTMIVGINDSKKVSPKKREALFDEIIAKAWGYAIASADVAEIEEYTILQATFLAMRRAVEGLPLSPDYVLIDGDKLPGGLSVPAHAVVKGDMLSASVAAASILAKVSRDRYMCEMDALYPQYAFAKHKGYGTALHGDRLRTYGSCPLHRQSFLKNYDRE